MTGPDVSRHEILRLQQRVPEEFSASRAEHVWHDMPPSDVVMYCVNVTDLTPGELLAESEHLLARSPGRNDYVYRVVLDTAVRTRRVVRE